MRFKFICGLAHWRGEKFCLTGAGRNLKTYSFIFGCPKWQPNVRFLNELGWWMRKFDLSWRVLKSWRSGKGKEGLNGRICGKSGILSDFSVKINGVLSKSDVGSVFIFKEFSRFWASRENSALFDCDLFNYRYYRLKRFILFETLLSSVYLIWSFDRKTISLLASLSNLMIGILRSGENN